MCIVCNCPKNGDQALDEHRDARESMVKAANRFMACSMECKNIEQGKQYKQIAYKMKKLIKEWNTLEQLREIK